MIPRCGRLYTPCWQLWKIRPRGLWYRWQYYCGDLNGRVYWPEIEPDDCIVRVNRDRLLHALGNLLTNAAKYSPPNGRIWIRAEAQGDRVRIAVSDEGYGIPQDLEHIFERYYRSPHGPLSATKGSGLGL